MLNSAVIEVAIGLMLIYLLLSLFCSATNEFIARILQWRSTNLRTGIQTMLDDLTTADKIPLASKFYSSPLIKGLTQIRGLFGKTVDPTYISPAIFSQTLLDFVAPSKSATPQTLTDIRQSVASLPDSEMKVTLLGMLNRADGDLSKARQTIEHWFDTTMEEVSACYQAWANTVLFFVALVLCMILNGDSVQIAEQLWTNPTLRAGMAAAADKYVATQPRDRNVQQQLQELQAQLQSVDVPLGWTSKDWRQVKSNPMFALKKLTGILFTTIAVSLGAPFWFDMLNKVTNFRSAAQKTDGRKHQ